MKIKYLFRFLVLFAILPMWQFAQGQTFSIVTPSNHTVYFQIENNEAEATFCSYSMPNYGSSLTGTLIIPDSVEYNNIKYPVTAIGYNAFHHAYGIDTVILPTTITTIKQEAFCACADLKSVTIPNSVTTLGSLAFASCCNLSDLTIGESVTTIGNQAFDGDTSLVSVVIPNSVVAIGQSAFSQNYSLRTIRFGSSLTSIGFACFTYCKNLDSLIFVTEVSPYYSGEFWGSPDTLNIIIPCGSYHSYSNRFGTQHHYTVPTVGLTMSISSSQPQWGSATIVKDADSNSVRCDSSVVIKALPNYGYHFQQWSNGSTNIQDTLFLVGDSTVSAIFAKNQYSLLVQSADPLQGSVSGSGVYNYLDTVVITATANVGYRFDHWSDGSTENPHTLTVTQGTSIIAIFEAVPFNVIVNNAVGGGVYFIGNTAMIYALPQVDLQFAGWSDGETANPRYIAVTSDTTLTALFRAPDTVRIYDTTTVYDTVINIVYDTTEYNHYYYDTTSVTHYIFDSTWVFDSVWVFDSIYIFDTVYIHDTIVVGVDKVDAINAKIYINNDQVVVEGAEGNVVWLYDAVGRLLATKQDDYTALRFDVPTTGTYLIKVGNHPARKVAVIR